MHLRHCWHITHGSERKVKRNIKCRKTDPYIYKDFFRLNAIDVIAEFHCCCCGKVKTRKFKTDKCEEAQKFPPNRGHNIGGEVHIHIEDKVWKPFGATSRQLSTAVTALTFPFNLAYIQEQVAFCQGSNSFFRNARIEIPDHRIVVV